MFQAGEKHAWGVVCRLRGTLENSEWYLVGIRRVKRGSVSTFSVTYLSSKQSQFLGKYANISLFILGIFTKMNE